MTQSLQSSYKKALFIFHRDLRLFDNTGLIFCLQNAQRVLPVFIFTKEQIQDNPYRGDPSLRFLLESLKDLEKQLQEKQGRLYLFYGATETIVKELLQTESIDCVVTNRDYTPFAIKRDQSVERICKKLGISFFSFDDALLHPPGSIMKKTAEPYQVFTSFYRKAIELPVLFPQKTPLGNYETKNISSVRNLEECFLFLENRNSSATLIGGRTEGLRLLQDFKRSKKGDFSYLSPYLKYSVLSPREVFHSIDDAQFRRSLLWRDFFTHVAFFFPHVFKGSFYPKYNQIQWSQDEKAFSAWCQGKTGFPIIDAAMRELKTTGWISNRLRMIVASFLIKDLHVSWQQGEKYFAKTLIDYDPAVNNGNWQWVAGTGCSAQPYFRVFNPWQQQKKIDPDCSYICQWIPELIGLSSQQIHYWHEQKSSFNGYPTPIVCHEKEAKNSTVIYKNI